MDKGQAERLMPMLGTLLSDCGIGWGDLAAIGVGTGPGNFTGVRIAVAAARGLALSLGVPAIGVTAFEALGLDLPDGTIRLVDARRAGLWLDAAGQAPAEWNGEALPAALHGRDTVGHQADRVAALTGGCALTAVHDLPVAIARIAAARFTVPHPRPAPFYLRGPDATPSSDPPPLILP